MKWGVGLVWFLFDKKIEIWFSIFVFWMRERERERELLLVFFLVDELGELNLFVDCDSKNKYLLFFYIFLENSFFFFGGLTLECSFRKTQNFQLKIKIILKPIFCLLFCGSFEMSEFLF